MSVSEETVRRTVKKLSKKGLASRVQGGAFLTGGEAVPTFFRRIGDRSREKKRIGRAAASLVGDGCPLFLDAGSTTQFVADALAHRSGLRVAANTINVANSLTRNTGNRVHLAGGELQLDKCGAFGTETLGSIERLFRNGDSWRRCIRSGPWVPASRSERCGSREDGHRKVP